MALTEGAQPSRRHLRRERGSTHRTAVTIREVAERAGVSTATVSRVFAGDGGRVSATTRRRVLRAAQDLGYRPNRAARTLARRRSGVVGVLLVEFGSGFVGQVMDGLVEEARESGREPLFASYGRRGEEGLRRTLDQLLETRPEGIIYYPTTSLPMDDASLVADLTQTPTVLVDMAVDGLDCPLVATDDVSGVQQAVAHLVSLGHQHIAHVAGPSWTSTGVTRLRAFREAMAAHGLPVAEQWVVPHDYTYTQAVTAAQRLFQARPLPSAVIAADDKCAAAVLEVARHAGMQVPEDLSVVGFSDTELCHTWYPPLTTVRQPKAEMGREALRALTALLEGNTAVDGARVRLLPTQLVVRGSCGPYAGPQEAPMP